jgi:hypothetical protein
MTRPVLRPCTKVELEAFVASYPRPLVKDVFGAFEPPLLTYNDFTLGAWPDSVVASVMLNEDSYPAADGSKIPNTYSIAAENA